MASENLNQRIIVNIKAVLKEAERFFFTAMLQGYVSGTKPVPVPKMPGFKEIIVMNDVYMLVDRWCVNNRTGKSFGTTTIWFDKQPIWVMTCGGYYPKEVIPFLKLALANTYGESEFCGGRGSALFVSQSNRLIYLNSFQQSGFSSFEGEEEICHLRSRERIGSHKYWGMSLI